MFNLKLIRLSRSANAICPECGERTVQIFTPPKAEFAGTVEGYAKIGSQEYVDWERAHLYCGNGKTNCSFKVPLMPFKTKRP